MELATRTLARKRVRAGGALADASRRCLSPITRMAWVTIAAAIAYFGRWSLRLEWKTDVDGIRSSARVASKMVAWRLRSTRPNKDCSNAVQTIGQFSCCRKVRELMVRCTREHPRSARIRNDAPRRSRNQRRFRGRFPSRRTMSRCCRHIVCMTQDRNAMPIAPGTRARPSSGQFQRLVCPSKVQIAQDTMARPMALPAFSGLHVDRHSGDTQWMPVLSSCRFSPA